MGARILGLSQQIRGYDIDADACATATAAGFERTRTSVKDLDPDSMRDVTGVIVSPPCPTFSKAGKRSALQEADHRAILEAITRLGDSHAGTAADDAYAIAYELVQDERSALVVEALRFALRLPYAQWVICEQVPAVAPIWEEMCAELAMAHDFEHCSVVTLDADDLGVASLRRRVFLIAIRHHTRPLSGLPAASWWTCGRFEPPRIDVNLSSTVFPRVTMAQALGWGSGERVNTRGARKTSGGNEFSADRPSWCLTEKARSWKRISDGAPLTASQAGLLTGFPADYPWRGSRSKQFLQAADVVSPPVAAAILGTALGLDWQQPVRDYLADLYSGSATRGGFEPVQPSLFDEVAA
ncbi:DNA cytosine methyltransferase [Nonomuraea basaltis]|nr:DNA cytosine methyltransferase [Nonomuraea basaltis]